ncbi:MAG: cation:proton antiporter [Lachnospiraceae bacterium]
METYDYLLNIAIILLSTKVLGLLTRKFQMPQVVGALLAGLLLGPAALNILKQTDLINELAEIGVIILMFSAGLETDIQGLKKAGKASFVIAMIGVIVPLIGGYALAAFFNQQGYLVSDAQGSIFLQNMFIGVILTATSVSITVETLREMGKLTTNVGNAILGAAIIDDILGIVALTIITSVSDPSVKLFTVLAKIVAFFIFAAVAGYIFHKLFRMWTESYNKDLRRFIIVSFVFCLVMSYAAERFFGVADITGAYIAGLMIAGTQSSHYVSKRFDTLSYMLLSPIFFASIGLKVVLKDMNTTLIVFAVLLVLVAVITKVIGCGLGALACKYTKTEALQIGVGMVSRGEVALIVAAKGNQLGLMSSDLFGPVVIVVVITTIIAPVLLKMAFRMKAQEEKTHVEDHLMADREEEHYQYKIK